MTPEAAIAALDRAVQTSGQDIRLRRVTGTQLIPFDVDCRACIREYEPDQLAGSIQQGDRKVILSPTEMRKYQWPWPPRQNDKVLIADKSHNVLSANNVTMGNELVRIELQIRG